ncbi:MAG TPA: hypothetical protein VEZ20_11585 [Allosphingosinicella sp.]|nr:hypothetical protein [Allosphingosinicella sp.]
MAASSYSSPPAWFRIAALVGLVWNGFGVAMYLSAVGVFGDPSAGMSEAERQAAESIPAWIMGAFAAGTFSGLLGSLGLILRKAWAQPVLISSLLALFILEGWIMFLSGAVETFGVAVPTIVVIGAVLLATLAVHARKRRWLA